MMMLLKILYMVGMIFSLNKWVDMKKSTKKLISGVVLIILLIPLMAINVAFLAISGFFQVGIVVILVREYFNI